MAVEEIMEKDFNKKILDYNSVYENGNIRYSKPQIIESNDLYKIFEELYNKFAADYYEENFEDESIQTREL